MATITSVRNRWKNHERAVAKHFGVTRNVFGRGEEGAASTDVVVPMENIVGIYRADTGPKLRHTHAFIECKYTNGDGGKLFPILSEIKKMFDGMPICTIGDYLIWEMRDTKDVLIDFVIPITEDQDVDPSGILEQYSAVQSKYKAPKYLDKWWGQVLHDIEYRNKKMIPSALPLLCAGCSGKWKIMAYKYLN